VSSPGPADSTFRFGEFAADVQAGELFRNGAKVRLQGQPFEVLALLLERPGQMVTREELRRRLWPADTFVDFEHGLNAAVNRLREALGDSAEQPLFIETIPRRGYKFIAPVEGAAQRSVPPVAQADVKLPRRRLLTRTLVTVILVILVSAAVSSWLVSRRAPRVTASNRLSFSGRVMGITLGGPEEFPALATDGTRIYFSSPKGGMGTTRRLAYVSVTGGDEVVMAAASFESVELRHISPDGSALLVYGSTAGEAGRHLWLVPATGAGPRRLGNIDGQDGAWSRDGHRFVYAKGQDLYVAEGDGSNGRKIITIPGKGFWIRWSPDAARIRFTLVDPKTSAQTLWECKSDGTDLHHVPLSWDKQPQECCGEWTPDGRYFLFRTFRENRAYIWLIREAPFLRRVYKPTRLTTGPLDSIAAIPSRNGKQLFVIGVQPRYELRRYDLKTRQFAPYLAGTSALGHSSSADGQWIAYMEERGEEAILWRSKLDGSERLQLTSPPMLVGWSQWSRDGKQIAFMAKMPDRRWNIYVVPASGGSPRALLPEEHDFADPEWSVDGHSLMFGRLPDYMAEPSAPKAIYTLNLDTNQVTTLPGSEGLYSPRWSPSGRYVVAMPLSEQRLMLFDFATQSWTVLTTTPLHIGTPRWSPDSEYVYFDDHPENVLLRVGRSSRKLEKVLDLASANPSASECDFDNLTWDGAPLIKCWIDNGDIYAFDLDLP
jgi:Tol biopolymer transport system component/DNA-binding winged helix-turn-helix (wHTH) protein